MDKGCNGGDYDMTTMWLMLFGGLMNETDYPWVGEVGTCYYNDSKCAVAVVGTGTGREVDEEELKGIIYDEGPMACAFNAKPLKDYTGGIIDLPKEECDPRQVR